MKRTIVAMLFALTLPGSTLGSEWETLFDGSTLAGWKATSDANWRVEDGAIVVDSGARGFLIHKDRFQNYQLTLEFKAA